VVDGASLDPEIASLLDHVPISQACCLWLAAASWLADAAPESLPAAGGRRGDTQGHLQGVSSAGVQHHKRLNGPRE